MVQVKSRCSSIGVNAGSGFLLGPRVVMTARHVLVDPSKGTPCVATVVQDGTRKVANVKRWMAIRIASSKAPTDIAIAILDEPLDGYNFTLSPTSPKPGQLVLALGYALGQPLSLNQGHVSILPTTNKVRLLVLDLLETHGASGGPIVNSNGEVVGVNQAVVKSGQVQSVDLAHMAHGDPTQFCFGVATGQASTICSAHKPAHAFLSRDGRPKVCYGYAILLPFQGCPTLTATQTPTTSTTPATSATPTITDCWVTNVDSWESSNRAYQVSDARPPLYFVQLLGQIPASSVTVTVTLTAPNGAVSTVVRSQPFPGAGTIFRYGPVGWTVTPSGFVTDGLWTFRMTLSTGATCSYAVNLQRA
jgi:hypothetical protein